ENVSGNRKQLPLGIRTGVDRLFFFPRRVARLVVFFLRDQNEIAQAFDNLRAVLGIGEARLPTACRRRTLRQYMLDRIKFGVDDRRYASKLITKAHQQQFARFGTALVEVFEMEGGGAAFFPRGIKYGMRDVDAFP